MTSVFDTAIILHVLLAALYTVNRRRDPPWSRLP